jgi:hypothetical protein
MKEETPSGTLQTVMTLIKIDQARMGSGCATIPIHLNALVLEMKMVHARTIVRLKSIV